MALPNGTFLRADIPPIEFKGEVVDSDPKQFTELSPELKRWLANFVDVFNQNMSDIESKI